MQQRRPQQPPSERSGSGEDRERSDAALRATVALAVAGDREAATALVQQFTPLVRSVVRRSGLHGAEAEDVVQETWVRLMLNLSRVREPVALPRWLAVTANRLCLNRFRGRARVALVAEVPQDAGPPTSEPATDVVRRDEARRLRRAVARLSERERLLVELLMQSCPYREISLRTGMPVGSIGPTRERVLRKLACSSELRSLREELTPAA